MYFYDGIYLWIFDLGRSIEKILVDEFFMCIYVFDRNEEKDIVFCYVIELNIWYYSVNYYINDIIKILIFIFFFVYILIIFIILGF